MLGTSNSFQPLPAGSTTFITLAALPPLAAVCSHSVAKADASQSKLEQLATATLRQGGQPLGHGFVWVEDW